MPQPDRSQVHVDRPLTIISTAFMQSADNFVADQVFPRVPVTKQSDTYFRYKREDFQRLQMKRRAEGTESAGSGYNLDTGQYICDVFALHKDVSDRTRLNADAPLDMNRDAVMYLSQQGMLNRDVTFVAKYFVAGQWDTDLQGVSGAPGAGQFQQWNESASIPIEDIMNNADAIGSATGFQPNVFLCGKPVWTALKNHPDVIDRIKYTQTGVVAPDLFANLVEVDKVVIAKAVVDTANELGTSDTDRIFGKHALLVYAAPNPGLLVPTGGYTFSWTGIDPAAGQFGNAISSFRMDKLKSDRFEIEMGYDQNLVAPSLGVFFEDAVA